MSKVFEIPNDVKTFKGQNGTTNRVSLPEGTEGIIRVTRGPRNMEELLEMITVKPGESNGWAEIVGKWPGDETDAEIDAALEELS